MARLKTNPVFTITISLLLAIAVGAGVLLYLTMGKVSAAARIVQQKSQVLDSFTNRTPFPSDENLSAVKADLAQSENLLATMQAALKGRGEFAKRVQTAVPPVGPTEAYFDLANFIEAMRTAAASAEVGIPEGTRFGFSTYSSTGPERDHIALVHRQRLVSEYLLTTLFKAKPQELVSLQRNRPSSTNATAAPAIVSRNSSSGNNNPDSDYFSIDERMTAAVPGFVETTGFKLTFIGYSSALRDFLNEIASFDLPLVVRSVEVESVATKAGSNSSKPAPAVNSLSALFGTAAPGGTSTAEPAAAQPIVDQITSRFTVTIEYINLVKTP